MFVLLEYFIEVVVDILSVADVQDDDLGFNLVYHVDGSIVSYPKTIIGRMLQSFSLPLRLVLQLV